MKQGGKRTISKEDNGRLPPEEWRICFQSLLFGRFRNMVHFHLKAILTAPWSSHQKFQGHQQITNSLSHLFVAKLPVSISTFTQLLHTTFALRSYWSLRPSWEGIPIRYIPLIWSLPPLLLLRDSKVVRPLTSHFINFLQFLEYARMHHSADCDS